MGRRLNRHALLEPRPKPDLVEVIRAVGGIHAQMMSAAEPSISVHVAGVNREDVRAELWQHRALDVAANAGLLSFGPAQSNKVTFTRADQ